MCAIGSGIEQLRFVDFISFQQLKRIVGGGKNNQENNNQF